MKCDPFELTVANSLIARQDDPIITAGFLKPHVVGGSAGKALTSADHSGTRLSKHSRNRLAVNRLV